MSFEHYTRQRPVKAVQTYRVDRCTGDLELQHEVVIDGQILRCRGLVSRRDMEHGVPVEYVDRRMRQDMMAGIEQHIYGDVL